MTLFLVEIGIVVGIILGILQLCFNIFRFKKKEEKE